MGTEHNETRIKLEDINEYMTGSALLQPEVDSWRSIEQALTDFVHRNMIGASINCSRQRDGLTLQALGHDGEAISLTVSRPVPQDRKLFLTYSLGTGVSFRIDPVDWKLQERPVPSIRVQAGEFLFAVDYHPEGMLGFMSLLYRYMSKHSGDSATESTQKVVKSIYNQFELRLELYEDVSNLLSSFDEHMQMQTWISPAKDCGVSLAEASQKFFMNTYPDLQVFSVVGKDGKISTVVKKSDYDPPVMTVSIMPSETISGAYDITYDTKSLGELKATCKYWETQEPEPVSS